MAAFGNNTKTVSELFDEGLEIFNGIHKNYEPTNSLPVQFLIKKCMHLLEDATNLVSLAGMFSANETIEEVTTNEVKFILLPALLGTLTLKLCISDRLEVIATAEVYFYDFLERCRNYGIIDCEIPKFEMPESSAKDETEEASTAVAIRVAPPPNMAQMACTRNRKIQRFKEQKYMESKIAQFEEVMAENEADDETKRSYYLTLIQYFSSQALDELDCLYSEKGFILTRPQDEEHVKPRKGRPYPRSPLKPVIISKGKKANENDSS